MLRPVAKLLYPHDQGIHYAFGHDSQLLDTDGWLEWTLLQAIFSTSNDTQYQIGVLMCLPVFETAVIFGHEN